MTGWLPESISAAGAAILVTASFFTSLLTASFGLGGGLALLAIMSYVMPIFAIIPVHGAVQFGSNAGRAFLQRRFISWRELTAFVIGGALGATAGAQVVVTLSEHWLELALGTFILMATWISYPRMSRMSMWEIGFTGAVTTFLTMFFGATGPLNAAAFEKTFPDRRVMVGTLAALQSSQHVLKLLAFGATGFAFAPWVALTVAMILTGFAGTHLGLKVLGRIEEKTFRTGLKIIMTLIGLDMLRRGLMAFW